MVKRSNFNPKDFGLWLGDSSAISAPIKGMQNKWVSMRKRLADPQARMPSQAFFANCVDKVEAGVCYADQHYKKDTKGGQHKAGDVYQTGIFSRLQETVNQEIEKQNFKLRTAEAHAKRVFMDAERKGLTSPVGNPDHCVGVTCEYRYNVCLSDHMFDFTDYVNISSEMQEGDIHVGRESIWAPLWGGQDPAPI